MLRQHEHSTNHLVRELVRRPNGGKFRTGPIGLCARANEIGGQTYQEPQHATPLAPQGKQEQGGLVQKQGAQSPPPGTYDCLNQPKASQNTQTLSSANPLPEKKGQLVGKVVYGKGGEEVARSRPRLRPRAAT